MPNPADSSPIAWWESLKHGGMLIAPARVAAAFANAPDPLSPWLADRLRREIVRAENQKSDLADLLDVVLEHVCGFTVGWFKGTRVGSEWSTRTAAGENIKPRRVWQHEGGTLPVFVDEEPRLGIGRGRRSVARVIEWLRARSLNLALLTNGRQWRLIYAGIDHDAHCEWDTQLWFAEGEPGSQVEALRRLIAPAGWKAPPPAHGETTHCALLQAILDSRKGQNELSAVLGERVRQAVELLIRSHGSALDRLTAQTEGGLPPVDGGDIYAAAVRTVMRMVVLLFAESRRLMPIDRSPLYFNSYSLMGLRESLKFRTTSSRSGGRSAWPRVLALFNLVREGCGHPDLSVPRYGGDLFTTRAGPVGDVASGMGRALHVFESACFQTDFAGVMPDETVHEVLELIGSAPISIRHGKQWLTTLVPVDFPALETEYIGILYEGLLDFELRRAGPDEPIVFLAIGDEPALPLSRLEAMDDAAIRNLVEKFKVKGGSDEDEGGEDADDADADAEDDEPTADEPLLAGDGPEEDPAAEAAQSAASGQDPIQQARERARTWARRAVSVGGMVRKPKSRKAEALAQYDREVQVAADRLVRARILPGQWYLVRWGGTRKGSGTFYTRPQLSVPTVHRTLRPLAYLAPADNADAPTASWTPKKPEEILALKVCDPAVGSGSFPVAALRFLTDALYRSLEYHGRLRDEGNKTVIALAEGRESAGRLDEDLLPCRPTDADFEPRLKARLRRYVVERCLYGVDLDPLAIELAKIALWIETMDRELPFSFLDHKFKCGNALVGCWFDRFRHYPIMAWLREGGDKGHTTGVHFAKDARTKAIAKHLKDVIKPDLVAMIDRMRGQGDLFTSEGKTAEQVHDEALSILEQMHRLPPGEDGEHRRSELHRQLRESPAYVALKRAFDCWCALWFWPADELAAAPRPSAFTSLSPEATKVAERIARERRFFHWELEFPDVFAAKAADDKSAAGFSAIIGNPPWDISKPNSKEFFSSIDPLYRTYGKQDALGRQKGFFTASPADEEHWLDYGAFFKSMSNWIDVAGHPFGDRVTIRIDEDGTVKQTHDFPLGERGRDSFASSKARHTAWAKRRAADIGYADPEHPFVHQGSADINLYKCFTEMAHALLRADGRLGFILPSGLYTDHGTTALRALLLARCRWEWLFGFENRDKVFDIDSRFKFNPVLIVKGGQTAVIRTAFMQRDPDDWALGVAEALAVPYARAQVERFSPGSKVIMEIRGSADLKLFDGVYAAHPLMGAYESRKGDHDESLCSIRYLHHEFFATADSRLFPPRPDWERDGFKPDDFGVWRHDDGRIARPIVEGRMIDAHDFSAKGWVSGKGRSAVWREIPWSAKTVEPQYLIADADYRAKPESFTGWKLTLMDVTSATNERTVHSTAGRELATIDSCRNLVVGNGRMDGALQLAAITNTFTFDYFARFRVGGLHLTWFQLEEMALPALDQPALDSLSFPTFRLCAAHIRYAPEWNVWADRIGGGILSAPWRSLWALSPHERLRLRCILDAAVAALYMLDLDDLKWILKDCDHPVTDVTNKAFARRLDPKGFWRVDKHEPPERRHTVLTPAAFADLSTLIAAVTAAGGTRDDAIAAFCGRPTKPLSRLTGLIGSIDPAEGWMLPENFCLADVGLGHDDRAQQRQPVAAPLGPRFYDWQLSQDAAESWRECALHARNLLGAGGFEKLQAELEGREEEPGSESRATRSRVTPDTKFKMKGGKAPEPGLFEG